MKVESKMAISKNDLQKKEPNVKTAKTKDDQKWK